MISTEKRCINCETDVGGKKRFKDAQGNYYCPVCWEDRSAPAPAKPATSEKLVVCESCKQRVPESQLGYSPAGDLVCANCNAVHAAAPCAKCGQRLSEAETLSGDEVCEKCRRRAGAPKRAATVVETPRARPARASSSASYNGADDSLGVLEYILCILFPALGLLAATIRLCQGDPRGKKMFKVIFTWFAIWFAIGLVIGLIAVFAGVAGHH